MANVGIPYSAISAAATSSCVVSGLEAHSTRSAPPAFKVIARFAVSVVICKQPDMRIPFKGISFAKRSRISRKTGISLAAHSMRSFPRAASERSLTSPRIDVVICYSFLHLLYLDALQRAPIVPFRRSNVDQNGNNQRAFDSVRLHRPLSGCAGAQC